MTGCIVGTCYKQIAFKRTLGHMGACRRVYHRYGLFIGLGVYTCMTLQIYLASKTGVASIHTVLPLHLCSMVGVLTLPMLLTKNQGLWEFCLYLGVPGSAMALVFPAMLQTPWPDTMALGFLGLHGLIFWAPFLPLALGKRPRPRGIAAVFIWGNLFLAFVGIFNYIFNTNYLFLRTAPKNTPLDWFFKHGMFSYLGFMEGAAALVLCIEALLVKYLLKDKNIHKKLS